MFFISSRMVLVILFVTLLLRVYACLVRWLLLVL